MWASNPGPAIPRAIGRRRSKFLHDLSGTLAQASFGRTCRITLKLAGTYSRTSATSSPIFFIVAPQSGQVQAGACSTVSRGRRSGSGRRAGRSFCSGLAAGNLWRTRLPARAVGFQLLDQELELADLRVELLGGATVLQPPKLGDEELEVLDLVVALGELRLTLDDQTLERLDVIGQITMR